MNKTFPPPPPAVMVTITHSASVRVPDGFAYDLWCGLALVLNERPKHYADRVCTHTNQCPLAKLLAIVRSQLESAPSTACLTWLETVVAQLSHFHGDLEFVVTRPFS